MSDDEPATADPAYAARLTALGEARWKRILDVQRPYRWNLRRLVEGRVLEVGCGIGRNLASLPDAVGVDHNADAVRLCRQRGLAAHLPADFHARADAQRPEFDTLLLAHVLEHMARAEASALLREYLPWLRPGGQIVLICPQEAGFASDATHVEFLDLRDLQEVARAAGGTVERAMSFPFPRVAGRFFRYNESVVTARVPG